MITKKIGSIAYEFKLPPTSKIHPVFHVSQLKKARGTWDATELPIQLTSDLELCATPISVLNHRYNSRCVLEVLIQWQDLPLTNSTWEEAPLIAQQFPEDKVKLQTGVLLCPSIRKRARSHTKEGRKVATIPLQQTSDVAKQISKQILAPSRSSITEMESFYSRLVDLIVLAI